MTLGCCGRRLFFCFTPKAAGNMDAQTVHNPCTDDMKTDQVSQMVDWTCP